MVIIVITIFEITRYLFLFLIFTLLLSISVCISGKKVFSKANVSKGKALIPIYNLYGLIEITCLPLYYFVMLFIPLLNIYGIFKLMKTLNEVFHGPSEFTSKLFLLPVVYLPMLDSDDFIYRIDEEDVSYLLEEDRNFKFVNPSEIDNTEDDEEEETPVVDSIYKGKVEQIQEEIKPYKAGRNQNQVKYYDDEDDD